MTSQELLAVPPTYAYVYNYFLLEITPTSLIQLHVREKRDVCRTTGIALPGGSYGRRSASVARAPLSPGALVFANCFLSADAAHEAAMLAPKRGKRNRIH
jgi:hypothetical protein